MRLEKIYKRVLSVIWIITMFVSSLTGISTNAAEGKTDGGTQILKHIDFDYLKDKEPVGDNSTIGAIKPDSEEFKKFGIKTNYAAGPRDISVGTAWNRKDVNNFVFEIQAAKKAYSGADTVATFELDNAVNSGVVVYSTQYKSHPVETSKPDNNFLLWFGNSSGKEAVVFRAAKNFGRSKAVDGSWSYEDVLVDGNPVPVQQSKWYQVDIVVDFNTNKVSLYIDGQKVDERAKYTNLSDIKSINMQVVRDDNYYLCSRIADIKITQYDSTESMGELGTANTAIRDDNYGENSADTATGIAVRYDRSISNYAEITKDDIEVYESFSNTPLTVTSVDSTAGNMLITAENLKPNREYLIKYKKPLVTAIDGKSHSEVTATADALRVMSAAAKRVRIIDSNDNEVFAYGKMPYDVKSIIIEGNKKSDASTLGEITLKKGTETVATASVEADSKIAVLRFPNGLDKQTNYILSMFGEEIPFLTGGTQILKHIDFDYLKDKEPVGDNSTIGAIKPDSEEFKKFGIKTNYAAGPRDISVGTAWNRKDVNNFVFEIQAAKKAYSGADTVATFELDNAVNSGVVVYSTQYKSHPVETSKPDNNFLLWFGNSSGKEAVVFRAAKNFGRSKAVDGSWSYEDVLVDGNPVPVQQSKWYQVDIVVDFNTNKVSLYIDGQKVDERAKYTNLSDIKSINMQVVRDDNYYLCSRIADIKITQYDSTESMGELGTANTAIRDDNYGENSADTATGIAVRYDRSISNYAEITKDDIEVYESFSNTPLTVTSVDSTAGNMLITAENLKPNREYLIKYKKPLVTAIDGKSHSEVTATADALRVMSAAAKRVRIIDSNDNEVFAYGKIPYDVKSIIIEGNKKSDASTLGEVALKKGTETVATASVDADSKIATINFTDGLVPGEQYILSIFGDDLSFETTLGDLKIKSVKILKADGSEVKTLSDINVNDDIYAEAVVENKSGESGKIILTLALYNGELLQSVIQANKEFYNNASDIVSTSNSKVKITNKTDLSIKTFVWGENLAPKCVPVLIGHQ